jgi:probable F420-dependent oxidoreductase
MGARLHVGIVNFLTDETIGAAALGQLAEAYGFESLFLPDHTHIPVSRKTPFPGGGELPGYYARGLDPFVALAAAAAVTTRLRLGTGVCLVVERDPIITAKAVASLDLISGGRVLFGVGAGWNIEEMQNHGADPARRFALLRERVAAMRAIWSQDEAEYHGGLVDFGPIWCWPKPIQRPGPSVLVGGNGPRVLARVLAWGDGWMPNDLWRDDRLLGMIGELRRRAERAGRTAPPVTIFGTQPDPRRIERYRGAGVARLVFRLPPAPADLVEERMAEIARLTQLGQP